jgi:ADP-ribose pyrophosphatase YjhB (NUDIX family)
MQALVVIDTRDMPHAQGLVLNDHDLSPDVFEVHDCKFELSTFNVGSTERVALSESGREMTVEEISQRYDAVVMIAGHNGLNNSRLSEFISRYLRGGNTEDWSNEAAIILLLPNTGNPEFHAWPADRVFPLPSALMLGESVENRSAEWVHQVRAELDGIIRTIDENQTRNPNVGFGLLLIDNKCNFFLMERLREPGRHTLGTIGGNFERGHSIEEQLDTILARRFGSNRAPSLELGPLLACTNMKNSYMHYVDITFLAIIRDGSVRNVADAELRTVQSDAIARLPARNRRNPHMFTLSEVAAFHREGRLFTPVASAFESFCRTILADQSRYGRKPMVVFPSLLNERTVINVPLPEDIDCVRNTVHSMQWSKSTLPFFEGDI